ncbi:MAG TPA: precorrin-6y C5,15-methyltransferase (decarboxylating) subunit CbiE [Acidimicrobiales bacterium]|nr:precorrin-6y C5,15-methyltransferase (decarboxylating) subunit CbiE [Acidimicrobiales bacterium]
MPELPIVVLGVAGAELGKDAARALQDADLVVGGARHLDALAPRGARRLTITGDLDGVLDAVAAEPGRVCVLGSGDPGFFGIVRVLVGRFGSQALEVHPAPSAVALAFARLGLPWDDAVVVSAHGRPLGEAARLAAAAPKVAVLTSPDNPPEALGRELTAMNVTDRRVAVCSRLGSADETVDEVDLAGLTGARWEPLSVVVLRDPAQGAARAQHPAQGAARAQHPAQGAARAQGPVLAWGLPDTAFAHRQGMVTKAEVRAVVLGKLALPPAGVLWDVGAGSASVAVECALIAPGLTVVAVECDSEDAERARDNAVAHGVNVQVVHGSAPGCLASLADPDRVFVGGGGLGVLDAVLARLRPGGRVVATYAAVDRAAAAAERLGHLVQVQVSRGQRLPDGSFRLAAQNPVFVAWGPDE